MSASDTWTMRTLVPMNVELSNGETEKYETSELSDCPGDIGDDDDSYESTAQPDGFVLNLVAEPSNCIILSVNLDVAGSLAAATVLVPVVAGVTSFQPAHPIISKAPIPTPVATMTNPGCPKCLVKQWVCEDQAISDDNGCADSDCDEPTK